MAASTLHASAGLLVGSACALRPLWHCWVQRLPMARVLGKWLAISYACALWATLPAILRKIGILSDAAATAPWTNLFLGYGLIEQAKADGSGIGNMLVAAIFCAQYTLLLLAIIRTTKTR